MQPTRILVGASVSQVLGEYDHTISFRPDKNFVILYGPNGIGKTKFLEIINAVGRSDASLLTQLPFESATLTYSDGSRLKATRSVEQRNLESDSAELAKIVFDLTIADSETISWIFTDDGFENWARQNLPYEQLDRDLWQDPSDGEIVHIDDLRARYARIRRDLSRNIEPGEPVPEVLSEFLEALPTYLIETQRLRIEGGYRHLDRTVRGRTRHTRRTRSRIDEQAEFITQLVNRAQTEHSRITQQLDRTFPTRVLRKDPDMSKQDSITIRERYDEQNEFRSRLGRIASVALDDELALPEGELGDSEMKLLELYLNDAEQKLEPFVPLLKKVELLEKIVNDRLLNKRLEVSASDGLLVKHTKSGQTIALNSLSSGEQHEIILMIDLLFSVPAGALVLIDEPEISLHVAWQIAFIPDVQQIAELSDFQFVVATHSPQIINDDWPSAISLGSPVDSQS